LKISRKSRIIIASTGVIALGISVIITFFADYFIPIHEPDATVASSTWTPWPNGTRLDVPPNSEHKNLFNIVIQNFSFTDSQGNFNSNKQPPITQVKRGVPTPIDVVVVPYLPGESGNLYVAIAFTYCAPLYYNNGQSRPCIEKNMDISLPQHIVSLNQHFNVTVTAPDNIPAGLYQLGIGAITLAYSPDSDKPSDPSVQTPFWINVA